MRIKIIPYLYLWVQKLRHFKHSFLDQCTREGRKNFDGLTFSTVVGKQIVNKPNITIIFDTHF